MKAWITRGGQLHLEEVPFLTPRADELVVRVEAISLNRGEVRGVARARDGFVPGWDVAGTVIAPAAGARGPAEGARVAALLDAGGWAEFACVPAARAAVVPDDVGLDMAATLPIAGLTVVRALGVAGSLVGKTALVTGASGGVGQFAVQLATLAGAVVTAVSSRAPEHARLRELGAAAVARTIEEAHGPFDFILESVGGGSLAAAVERVARGGVIVTIGNSSEQETTLNARTLYAKGGASIYGLIVFEEMESGRVVARDLERLLELVRIGRLHASIEIRRPWTELPAVLADLERRSYAGKAVLTI